MWSSLLKVNMEALGTPASFRQHVFSQSGRYRQVQLTSLWLMLHLLLAFSKEEGLEPVRDVNDLLDFGLGIAVDARIGRKGLAILGRIDSHVRVLTTRVGGRSAVGHGAVLFVVVLCGWELVHTYLARSFCRLLGVPQETPRRRC